MTELKSAPVAYQNEPFLNSPDGRILRMLAEYQEPLARFRREQIQDTVVFFGSARFQGRKIAAETLAAVGEKNTSPKQLEQDLKRAQANVDMARYYEDARKLAYMLTKWSITIPARRHPWRPRGRRQEHRPEHTAPVRAAPQPVHHALAQLPVPLFLHAEVLVRL